MFNFFFTNFSGTEVTITMRGFIFTPLSTICTLFINEEYVCTFKQNEQISILNHLYG